MYCIYLTTNIKDKWIQLTERKRVYRIEDNYTKDNNIYFVNINAAIEMYNIKRDELIQQETYNDAQALV